jgi:hypothetical protein
VLTRAVRVLPWLLILAAAIVLLAGPTSAAAQAPALDGEDPCYTCHESLYRLHDIGKAFCLCGAPMECTCCHGGVAGEWDADAAHEGMVARPLAQDAPPCQSCHPDDYEARQAIFVARAGVSATPCPTMEALISSRVASLPPVESPGLEAWQVGLVSLLGLALIALIVFAYRCWKKDCLAKGSKP